MSAHPREKLHELVSKRMAKLRLRSTKYALEQSRRAPVFDPETGEPLKGADGKPIERSPWELRRWDERSVADVMCNAVLTMHEAGERANKMANRPQSQLAVVVVPARIEDRREWEAKAKALSAQGQRPIDTTIGPALLEVKK